MNEELNEQEISQLEQELRSYGDPYASPEPDPRYFANFRMRVMDRISAEPETVGFVQRVTAFFFGSPLRMAFTGSTLVAGALLYFSMQSSPEAPVAQMQPQAPAPEVVVPQPQPSLEQPAVTAPAPLAAVQPKAAPAHKNIIRQKPEREVVTPQPQQNDIAENLATSGTVADAAAEFDHMDELTVSDETAPVSYDKLSMEELETILKTLETEPLTIQ